MQTFSWEKKKIIEDFFFFMILNNQRKQCRNEGEELTIKNGNK